MLSPAMAIKFAVLPTLIQSPHAAQDLLGRSARGRIVDRVELPLCRGTIHTPQACWDTKILDRKSVIVRCGRSTLRTTVITRRVSARFFIWGYREEFWRVARDPRGMAVMGLMTPGPGPNVSTAWDRNGKPRVTGKHWREIRMVKNRWWGAIPLSLSKQRVMIWCIRTG